MGTSWKATDITKKFNDYNDMLENVLGFQFLLDEIQKDKNNKKILDYGCGPGKVSYKLAEISERDYIIAVDESEGMLEIAKSTRGKKNINYCLIAEDNLEFIESNSIDYAIICFVFINNCSQERILKIGKELFRVLKIEGKLLVLDSNPDAIGFEFTTFKNGLKNKSYIDGEQKTQYLHIPNCEDLVINDFYWSREFYVDILENSGFSILKILEPTINGLTLDEIKQAEEKYNVSKWRDEEKQAPFIIFEAIKKEEECNL